MKKNICLLVVLITFLFSCLNNNKIEDKDNHTKEITLVLNEDLKEHAIKFINECINNDSSMKNITFSIEFVNSRLFLKDHKSDTLIFIHPMSCNSKIEGFKGIVLIVGSVTAIVDNFDIGNNYYTDYLLLDVPLDSLKCSQDTLGGIELLVKGEELYDLGPYIILERN